MLLFWRVFLGMGGCIPVNQGGAAGVAPPGPRHARATPKHAWATLGRDADGQRMATWEGVEGLDAGDKSAMLLALETAMLTLTDDGAEVVARLDIVVADPVWTYADKTHQRLVLDFYREANGVDYPLGERWVTDAVDLACGSGPRPDVFTKRLNGRVGDLDVYDDATKVRLSLDDGPQYTKCQ